MAGRTSSFLESTTLFKESTFGPPDEHLHRGDDHLDLGGATVDEEFDAVDEARVVGGEEEGDGCDLFRAAHFAAWDQGFEALFCVRAERIEDRRVDGAGAEDVHANSSLLELDQPGASEGAHGSFAGAVDAERRKALDAGDGAVEEDGAVVVEERQRLLHGEERAAHVEVEGLVEVFFGDLFERGELALAGAGEEDVDLALFALDGLVEAVEVGEIGGVALHAGDVFADELHGLIELLLAASGDEDVRALFDEELGGCERHAGGRGGDDCYFSFELSHDCYSLHSAILCNALAICLLAWAARLMLSVPNSQHLGGRPSFGSGE